LPIRLCRQRGAGRQSHVRCPAASVISRLGIAHGHSDLEAGLANDVMTDLARESVESIDNLARK
jgi:hypothetical protein